MSHIFLVFLFKRPNQDDLACNGKAYSRLYEEMEEIGWGYLH